MVLGDILPISSTMPVNMMAVMKFHSVSAG